MTEMLRLVAGIAAALLMLLTAGCGRLEDFAASKRAPSSGYRYLDLLLDEPFDNPGDWRSYADGDALFLGVADGAYHIDFSGRRYVWAQGDGAFKDVVIEAYARQVSAYDYNAFGLACRLDPGNSGRGYFFLISGDGHASIRWSNGRSLEAIVPATPTRHIKRGRARNRIRAVCIGDTLALWVNGQFVAEARDSRRSGGAIGMAGVMNYAGRSLHIEFDDLKAWRAAPDEREA